MKIKFRHVIVFGVGLLSGCSYYGTNTFLVPKNNTVICSDVRIEVGSILTAQKKRAYAFAGIPYFPALFPSTPAETGELQLWFQNIPKNDICTTEDLILKDIVSQVEYLPLGTWKSRLVEKDGINYLGCNYKFGLQLGATEKYNIHFKEGLLNCKLPEVPLSIEKDSGYHQILVQ
jgi:hypothetical protein